MSNKLKPCPFCGGEAEKIFGRIRCSDNSCGLGYTDIYPSQWKYRPIEDALKTRITELEKELSQSNFYYEKYQEYEELFKEAVVKHELAKARIAELEAERAGLEAFIGKVIIQVVDNGQQTIAHKLIKKYSEFKQPRNGGEGEE